MHLVFKLQAIPTGACLLILVTRQPQQSLPQICHKYRYVLRASPIATSSIATSLIATSPTATSPTATSLCLEPFFAVP